MRFVAVKSAEQQAVLTLHRARALLVRQRTMAANALRAAFAEFGVVAPQGRRGLQQLVAELPAPEAVPASAHPALTSLARHWRALDGDIEALERHIVQAVRADCVARRLLAIPGVGPIGASALVATLPDARVFRSGRGFAAWLGLTPRQHNTAGKRRSAGISKQGQRSLRSLLIVGASAHLRQERARGVKDPWLAGLLARRPVKVAAVARAAKTARIVWAMLARNQAYRAPLPQAA
jgi:transposase